MKDIENYNIELIILEELKFEQRTFRELFNRVNLKEIDSKIGKAELGSCLNKLLILGKIKKVNFFPKIQLKIKEIDLKKKLANSLNGLSAKEKCRKMWTEVEKEIMEKPKLSDMKLKNLLEHVRKASIIKNKDLLNEIKSKNWPQNPMVLYGLKK